MQAAEQQKKGHATERGNIPGNSFVYDEWLDRMASRYPPKRLKVEIKGGPAISLAYATLFTILQGLLEYQKIYVHTPPHKNDQIRMTNFTMLYTNDDGDYAMAVGKTVLYTPLTAEGVNSSVTRYVALD